MPASKRFRGHRIFILLHLLLRFHEVSGRFCPLKTRRLLFLFPGCPSVVDAGLSGHLASKGLAMFRRV